MAALTVARRGFTSVDAASQLRDNARFATDILQRAIDAGGSTIADFLSASGHPGYFQLQHHVYGRDGQPCHCCGRAVVKTVLAGRSTYSCHRCQPAASTNEPKPAPSRRNQTTEKS